MAKRRQYTDSQLREIQEINSFREEYGDRLVAEQNDRVTAWAKPPGDRQLEMESLNQHLAAQAAGDAGPYSQLSDDELIHVVEQVSRRG